MNKDYEMLNETKIDFDKYEVIEIDELEKERMKKRLNSKINKERTGIKKSIAIAAIVLILSGSLLFNNTVVQATIEDISNRIGNFFGVSNNIIYDDYIKVIGTIKDDKGVKITLNEVVIKEEGIIINTNFDVSKTKEVTSIAIEPNIYINGESVNNNMELKSYEVNNENGKIDIIQKIGINKIDISEELDVKIKYSKIYVFLSDGGTKEIEGDWEFTFKDNGEVIANKTKTIDIKKEINIGDGYIYKIDTAVISPLDIILKYNIQELKEEGYEKIENNYIGFMFTDINRKDIVSKYGNTRRSYSDIDECRDINILHSEVRDKIILVPYKEARDKYDTLDETINNREYLWQHSIEIDVR